MPVLHFATEIVRLIRTGRFALERGLKGGGPGGCIARASGQRATQHRVCVRSPRSGGVATGGAEFSGSWLAGLGQAIDAGELLYRVRLIACFSPFSSAALSICCTR